MDRVPIYTTRLRDAGAQVSLAAVGNPYANAEGLVKTLTREEVYLTRHQTFQEAEEHLGRFITDIDNAKRLHSSLCCRPPIEFEANCLATVKG